MGRINNLILLGLAAILVTLGIMHHHATNIRVLPPTLPIIISKTNKIITITPPDTFLEQDEANWKQIEVIMNNAVAGDVIQFRWEGYGGEIVMGNDFVRSMQEAEARGVKIKVDVIGASYSMHANVVCYASEFTLEPGVVLGFHAVAYLETKDGVQVKHYDIDTAAKQLEDFFLGTCANRGLLTTEQVKIIEDQHKLIYVYPSSGGVSSTVTEDL